MADADSHSDQQQQQQQEPQQQQDAEALSPTAPSDVAPASVESPWMATAFDGDSADYNVKHQLHHAWTLWYDNPAKRNNQTTWSQNLKELVTFDTVEEFWGVYNNVVPAADLPIGATYHLFKKGIKPMWEDPANELGGKWTVQYPRRVGEEVNKHWLNAVSRITLSEFLFVVVGEEQVGDAGFFAPTDPKLLACIGEHFESEDEVCGAVLGVRKGFYRLSLWTRNAAQQEVSESVGCVFKAALETAVPLEYAAHDPTKVEWGDRKLRV